MITPLQMAALAFMLFVMGLFSELAPQEDAEGRFFEFTIAAAICLAVAIVMDIL